jgi:thiamine-monophosphate kinase
MALTESLADIGEFGLIERIHGLLKEIGVKAPGVSLGIGDDAASFQPRSGYEFLITCDSLIEGRHYLPHHTEPLNLGRRAMAVNISDIGAMGGHPLYAVVSMGLKPETLVAHVEDMYRGFIQELNPFQASIIGGNFTGSQHTVFIDITLIGEVKRENIMLRSSARAGDTILVTGYPGQAAAGLLLLKKVKAAEDMHAHPLVKAYNVPKHRAKEGRAIALSRKANAMIDTSDGFLADLGHICKDSRLGAVLIQEKLPISPELKKVAFELEIDPYHLFLGESDDYELIVTCPPENVPHVRSAVQSVGQVPVHEVGRITDTIGDIQWVHADGTKRPVNLQGWDHFKR